MPLFVFPIRLSEKDIQALKIRAGVERSKPATIARQAIRDYLQRKT